MTRSLHAHHAHHAHRAAAPSTPKAAAGRPAQVPSAFHQQQWKPFHVGTGPRQG